MRYTICTYGTVVWSLGNDWLWVITTLLWARHILCKYFIFKNILGTEPIIWGFNSTCLFLMEVWMTEGPCVNFVMREALFKIYTWILCLSYLHEKQTSRIKSLYLYCIKIVPFWLQNIRFFNTKHPVIILRGSLFVITGAHVASWKNGCQNFLMFIVAENSRSVNIRWYGLCWIKTL